MSPSRRRALARYAAWQVAHAESVACRGSVRNTVRGRAAHPARCHDRAAMPPAHSARALPGRRDTWPPGLPARALPRIPPARFPAVAHRIARGGSPPTRLSRRHRAAEMRISLVPSDDGRLAIFPLVSLRREELRRWPCPQPFFRLAPPNGFSAGTAGKCPFPPIQTYRESN